MTKLIYCCNCEKETPHVFIKMAKPTTQAEYKLFYTWRCEVCGEYQANKVEP